MNPSGIIYTNSEYVKINQKVSYQDYFIRGISSKVYNIR